MDTLRQLFSKMEAMLNAHTPGQNFAVLMDMALVHISADTKQMLQEEFGHIRVIMIRPHTTSFLEPCDNAAKHEARNTRHTETKRIRRRANNGSYNVFASSSSG